MSVQTVKARLTEIQSDGTLFADVARAYGHAPNTINAADMPCWINFTGPATYDHIIIGADENLETREYKMRLYVLPYGAGAQGEAENLCEPFFPIVRDVFNARPGLEYPAHLPGVQTAILLGDSGVNVLPYNGQFHWGIEFRLQVTEIVQVDYVG